MLFGFGKNLEKGASEMRWAQRFRWFHSKPLYVPLKNTCPQVKFMLISDKKYQHSNIKTMRWTKEDRRKYFFINISWTPWGVEIYVPTVRSDLSPIILSAWRGYYQQTFLGSGRLACQFHVYFTRIQTCTFKVHLVNPAAQRGSIYEDIRPLITRKNNGE